MNRILVLAAALAAACLGAPVGALAHAVCGDRVFPATLIMDDPGVGDEFSFPTIQYTSIPAAAGGGQTLDYAYEWDKTITEHFGFAINGDYIDQRSGGVTEEGWDNITVTLKDEFLCAESDEFMASVGLIREFGSTGSTSLINAGVIPAVSNTAPTLYVGKGLGGVAASYLRPVGVTGELGYQISDSPNSSPDALVYSASLQYSFPYLQQNVKAGDLGFLGNTVALVEMTFTTPQGGPVHQPTTGTIAPGFLYEGDTWQFGLEMTIPANGATREFQGVGVLGQFHLFLDDIFPDSLGKPLF